MAERESQQLRITVLYAILANMFAAGITLNLVGPGPITMAMTTLSVTTPIESRNGDFASKAVRIIDKTGDWNATIASGRCVLFVNCDWNAEIVVFRQPFSDFSAWCHDNNDYKTISVKLDGDSEDEMWNTIQDLWRDHAISPGGMKNYGGAGRVVWFDNGQVVDHAWCPEVFDLEKLKSRTKNAYQ